MDVFSYLLGKKQGGGGTGNLEEKEVTITSNTTTLVRPSTGYDGLSSVEVITNVEPTLEEKSLTILSNTTTLIEPSEGYDGLSSVSVTTNVSLDTSDMKDVINKSGASLTSQSPFSDYPQALYDDYIDLIKNGTSDLYENMTRGTSTGTINDAVDFPIYEMKMTKESTQAGTPTPQNPIPIETVVGATSRNLAEPTWASDFVTRVANTSNAKLETFQNRNCIWWKARAYSTNEYFFKINWKPNTQYRFKFACYGSTISINISILYTDGTKQGFTGNDGVPANQWNNINILSQEGKTINYVQGEYYQGNNYIDLDTFMVSEGTGDYNYEPYGVGGITINMSDGTNSKNVNFSLNGYEVVGKDDNLDEIIIGKTGNISLKKVFNKIDSYNGETITTDYISTTGGLDTGATVYYVRSTPQIIDLNQTVDLTLYEGNNTITNSESMNENITYIKNTYE